MEEYVLNPEGQQQTVEEAKEEAEGEKEMRRHHSRGSLRRDGQTGVRSRVCMDIGVTS